MAKISVIETSDSLIKVAEVEIEIGKLRISKIGISEINTFQDYGEQLPKLLKELSIEANQFILSIPRSKVSVHYLSLPATNPQELKEMAKFQALKQLPYSKGEILHSYRIIKKEANMTKIMLVVVRQEAIEQYLEPFRVLKIEPDAITIDTMGIANWAKNMQPQLSDYCLIDLDWKATNITIFSKGDFIFSREVNKGVEMFDAGPAGVEELILEIQRSISAYNKENIGPAVNKILIVGAEAALDKLQESLTNVMTVEIAKRIAHEGIDLREINVIRGNLRESQFSLTKLIGFSQGPLEFDINLMPSEIVRRRMKQSLLKSLLTNTIYYSLFIAGIWMTVWWEYQRQEIYVQQARQKLKELKRRITLLDRKRKIIEITLDHIKRESSFLAVLKEVYRFAPDNVFLKNLSYRKNKVIISGITTSLDDVVKFMENMQSSPLFARVIQKYASQSRRKQEVSFQLEALLKK